MTTDDTTVTRREFYLQFSAVMLGIACILGILMSVHDSNMARNYGIAFVVFGVLDFIIHIGFIWSEREKDKKMVDNYEP